MARRHGKEESLLAGDQSRYILSANEGTVRHGTSGACASQRAGPDTEEYTSGRESQANDAVRLIGQSYHRQRLRIDGRGFVTREKRYRTLLRQAAQGRNRQSQPCVCRRTKNTEYDTGSQAWWPMSIPLSTWICRA